MLLFLAFWLRLCGGYTFDRLASVHAEPVLTMIIGKRKDTLTTIQKAHSASANVHILDTAFFIPQLGRTRRIWIYLPAGYFTTRQRYPVLYMQDGQNLFDAQTSYAGEWGVDEIMDAMQAACIVVGIDNGGVKRMTEYNPNDHPQQGKGEGKAYLEFIVKTLKPVIDKRYRTRKTKSSTSIAGSSMGGLISFYAGLYYPSVFGSVGVLSPSFWIAPQVKTQLAQLSKKKYAGQRYFFYAGGGESAAMVSDMLQVAELMKTYTKATIKTSVSERGQHNEQTWGAVFPEFYNWAVDK